MKLIFTCPKQKTTFESANFKVINNKGVVTDVLGHKTLDADVELNEHCPFCGEKHVYHASELSCPYGMPRTSEANKEKVMIGDPKKVRLTETVTGSG
jgi:hypothetical protein